MPHADLRALVNQTSIAADLNQTSIASQFGLLSEQCGTDPVCSTVVDAVLMLLLFIGLAIVCDDYLCPAIEELCARFKVPDEAAGASFLAFGSAAPEIMINVAATRRQNVDLSVPAIMGSAIIAYGFIPAACFFGVRQSFELKIAPTLRDTFFYLVALGFLLHVVHDGTVELQESLAISSIFVFYMLAIWLPLRGRASREADGDRASQGSEVEMPEMDTSCGLEQADEDVEQGAAHGDAELLAGSDKSDAVAEDAEPRTDGAPTGRPAPYRDNMDEALPGSSVARGGRGGDDEDEDEGDCWANNMLLDVASKPFRVIFACTIPDPEKHPGWYFLTFAVSLFYVAVLSELVCSVAEDLCAILHVPHELAGVTLLALGAQVPDTIAAVSMARNKMYDGAITSAIGSQILNITLGMGVPFAVWSWTNDGKPMTATLGNIHSVSVCLGVSVALYIICVVRYSGGWKARVTASGSVVMILGYLGCNAYMVKSMAGCVDS